MIGSMIGNYRVVEKLGEGGMGVVYKAVDALLERPVAIKMLPSELSRDAALMQRFQAEARAQANLSHTNLATLYAFLAQDGNYFMVMEYVEGETFAQMVGRRGPIPAAEIVPLFKQVLLGLGYAHRQGVIHRDIKPGNLMVNRAGIVKVMDFGIAKVLGGRQLTRTGTQMGTVTYMSPEQIQNRAVDIRSDIYALGVTLYELVSGRVPFEGDSDFQVMMDHVNTAPPLPTKFYPYLPKGLEAAILRALAKNPDERFQTVEAFGAALEQVESGVAQSAAPATAVETMAPRRATGWGAAAAAQPAPIPMPLLAAPARLQTPVPITQPATSMVTAHLTVEAAARPVVTDAGEPSSPELGARFQWLRPKVLVFGGGGLLLIVLTIGGVSLLKKPVATSTLGSSPETANPLTPPAPTRTSTPPPTAGTETTTSLTSMTGPGGKPHKAPSVTTAQITPTPRPETGGQSTPPGVSGPTSVVAAAATRVQPGSLVVLSQPAPAYPVDAKNRGVTGTVLLEAEIDEMGSVDRLREISGPGQLVQPAIDAVRQWKYQPPRVGGKMVRVVTSISVPFQLSDKELQSQTLVQQAEQAIQSGKLFEPANDSAVYYARRARELDPSNSLAIAVEGKIEPAARDRIFLYRFAKDTAQRNLEVALDTARQLAQAFPSQANLNLVRQIIEQHHMAAPAPKAQGAPPPPVAGAPSQPERLRVGGAVQQANLSHQVRPAYPEMAKKTRVQGAVVLEAVIGKDGSVRDVKAVSGHPLLVPAAMDAVKQWKYKPTLLNGHAVEVVTTVTVNFTL